MKNHKKYFKTNNSRNKLFGPFSIRMTIIDHVEARLNYCNHIKIEIFVKCNCKMFTFKILLTKFHFMLIWFKATNSFVTKRNKFNFAFTFFRIHVWLAIKQATNYWSEVHVEQPQFLVDLNGDLFDEFTIKAL